MPGAQYETIRIYGGVSFEVTVYCLFTSQKSIKEFGDVFSYDRNSSKRDFTPSPPQRETTNTMREGESLMSNQSPSIPCRCLKCGFEAAADSDEWESVDVPPLGVLTQCPECGSTDILSRQ